MYLQIILLKNKSSLSTNTMHIHNDENSVKLSMRNLSNSLHTEKKDRGNYTPLKPIRKTENQKI